MKVSLNIGDKEITYPHFEIFPTNTNSFIFALENIDLLEQEQIKNYIDSLNIKIFFNENDLFLETDEKYYCFCLDEYDNIFPNHDFYIGFDFLDSDGKIPGEKRKVFTIKCK